MNDGAPLKKRIPVARCHPVKSHPPPPPPPMASVLPRHLPVSELFGDRRGPRLVDALEIPQAVAAGVGWDRKMSQTGTLVLWVDSGHQGERRGAGICTAAATAERGGGAGAAAIG